MWIGKIELPEELVNAQIDGKLVIFAGAGVSMNQPSNLPDFRNMVKEIQSNAGNLLKWDCEKEPPDRFLGRLKDKGPNVHKLAWDIINGKNSKPTDLHYDLLLLFNSSQEVRIVTTNFDTHFTTVASELFGDEVPIYHAPALPLGHRFNGIVYLHGCVDQKPEELIITDKDFGRAYLTEGWATRFLVEIFSSYKVLFVGYSHNDLPMEYLGRGLAPETKRYALVPENEIEKWRFRGIELISYPHSSEDRNHNKLIDTVKSWAKQTRMGFTEHEQRIKDIVRFQPPLDKEQASYIEEAIKDPIKARIFTRYAETVEWLRWIEEKGIFESLFSLSNPSDEISQIFAWWFAEKYVCCHPEEALALVQRHGSTISPLLLQCIAASLQYTKPLPKPKILAKWITVLIAPFNRSFIQGAALNYLLQNCCHPEYKTIAILLFKYLSNPYLALKPSFAFFTETEYDGKQVSFELTISGEHYWLDQVWKEFFIPNLKDYVFEIEPIITEHIKEAHRLLCSVGCADDKWDPVSYRWTAIERYEHNQYLGGIDILINAARDIIECLLKYYPERAQIIIQEWALSNTPILKRLAIYGMTISCNRSPNEKLQWLLTNNWLFSYGLKHEIFQLLKEAYSQTDEAIRQRLLDNIENYLADNGSCSEDPDAVENRSYEVYNLLYWLVKVAPHCILTRQKFSEVQATHPEFQPREYPDLDWYGTVGWIGLQSPITLNELISKPPSEIIEFLLTYQGGNILEPNREGLLFTVKNAVVLSFSWCWELVKELKSREKWSTDIWDAVISGWQCTHLTETQLDQVLQFLDQHKEMWKHSYRIAEFLKETVKNNERGLSILLLFHAEALADKIWQEMKYHNEIKIDHVGDIITQFWILALSRRQAEKDDDCRCLPDEYKARFERIITEKSEAAAMGRVVLASQLHFLFSLDSDWTSKKILPLLDFNINEQRAMQAWNGYLQYENWNNALLSDLLPLYEQAYNKLPKESVAYDQLLTHLAGIAVRSLVDPLNSDWLDKFISSVDEGVRINWVNKVAYQLINISPEAAKEIWDKWIKKYWYRRINGIPCTLTRAEVGAMVKWALELQPVFPEIVDLIVIGPEPVIQSPGIYLSLKEKFVKKYPRDTARLLICLLKAEHHLISYCSELKKLFNDISESLSPDEIKPLKDELIRLDCF